MRYTKSDLTVIIPTIDSRVELLSSLLIHLSTTKIEQVIIVWDSASPRPELPNCNFTLTLVEHDKNRGLSAARNTGISKLTTSLGMFIDDDIRPDSDFVDLIVDFHNQHPETRTTTLSKVTWQGTEYQNAITSWFEEFGNWSVFSTTESGAIMPTFAGGFTSFKKEALADIKFNERFTSYGCEDIEFGQRFFKEGGKQIYLPELVGRHYKLLTAQTFAADCLGSGFSNYIFFTLWPNDYHCINTMKASFTTNITVDDCEQTIMKMKEFEHNIENSILVAPIISYLGNVCDISGFRNGIVTDYPNIKFYPELTLENNLAKVLFQYNECKPAMLLLAIEFPKNSLILEHWYKHRANWNVLKALLTFHSLPITIKDNVLYETLKIFQHATPRIQSDIQKTLIEVSTAENICIPKVISDYKIAISNTQFDMREAYALAVLSVQKKDYATALEIALNILAEQNSHVGSWLIAANYVEDKALRQFFFTKAEHYLKFRPKSEQIKRQEEMSKLKGLLFNDK